MRKPTRKKTYKKGELSDEELDGVAGGRRRKKVSTKKKGKKKTT